MVGNWAVLADAIHMARALPQAETTAAPAHAITGALTLTESTPIASPTTPLTATLPSQVPLPPVQAWCLSKIFCAGAVRRMSIFISLAHFPFFFLTRTCSTRTLKTVNIADLVADPNTFVDKPINSAEQPPRPHLRPSTRPMPPRPLRLTLLTITSAAKALNSRYRRSPTLILIRLSQTM